MTTPAWFPPARGTVLEGVVVQHEPFGVFVDLGDGITGLVEIVSLPDADTRRLNIADFPPVGSRIRAVVLLTHGRQPRLGMRRADYERFGLTPP